MKIRAVLLLIIIIIAGPFPAPLAADYKPEFKLSVVPNEDTSWGRAANRFAYAIRYRTEGRIQIENYFSGRLFPGRQTTEFDLLQQGIADFAIGSTINWSPQIKELNLFSLPFMFPNYAALDAVEAGEPGKRLFELIEAKGVVPIALGGERLQGGDELATPDPSARGSPGAERPRGRGADLSRYLCGARGEPGQLEL